MTRPFPFRRSILLALFAASIAFAGIPAFAQQATGPDSLAPSAPEDASRYLDPIYKDDVAGFEIAPPAGSRIINRAGLDLVSFVNDTRQWGGSVTMAIEKTPISVSDYLQKIPPELSKTFRAVQVLDSKVFKFQGKDAGRMTTSMQAELGPAQGLAKGPGELVALYRQQLVVKVADTQFMVLTFYTPLRDRDLATSTFNAMLSTFQLVDRATLAKQLAESVQNAKTWLANRSADELKAKLLNQPQLFRIKIGGRDMGYIRFDEREDSREHGKGVLVDINTRSFPPDGSVVMGHNSAFWQYAGNAPADNRPLVSTWEVTTETVLNRPNMPKKNQTFWVRELGTLQLAGLTRFSPQELADMQKHREEMIRANAAVIPPPIPVPVKRYEMQIDFTGDPTQPPRQSLDLSIPLDKPAVLPPVLAYLWPRVVDLNKPTRMTFVVYNSGLHKLTYRTLSVVGPDRILINRKPVDCIRCTDELEPNSTTMWVDSQGKVLLMRTSDQTVLTPTTSDEMEQLWGSRLKSQ